MNTKHSFLLCMGKGSSLGSRQAWICALVCFFMGISPSAWAADTIISTSVSTPQNITSESLIITDGGSLTVSGWNGTAAGSAVNVASGNFTVTGTGTVSLNGNKVESTSKVDGGAVAVVTGLFTLESSGENQFVGNTAFSTGSYARGGALFAEAGIGITNGTNIFSTNRAITESSSNDARGGALFSSNTITISGGVNSFSGNTVNSVLGRGFGGALSIEGNFAVTISGGTNTFTGNTAGSVSGTGYGGAIYSDGDVILSGGTNTFENNSALGGANGYGGAIATRSGDVSLSGTTTFRGNTASTSGGAVWMGKTGGLLTLKPVQVTDVITFATATDTIGGEDLSVEISGAGRVVTNALNTASSGISSLAVQSGTLQLGTADTNSETFFGGLNTFTLNGGATLAFYADTVGNRTVPYIAMQDSGGRVNLAEGSTLYAVIGDKLRAVQTAGKYLHLYVVFKCRCGQYVQGRADHQQYFVRHAERDLGQYRFLYS